MNEFDQIFSSTVDEETFIIFNCVDPNSNCGHQLKSSLWYNPDIEFYVDNNKISIPFKLTAVRIFIYYKGKIYYIKRSGFSRLEGGKLDEFLDLKMSSLAFMKLNEFRDNTFYD